MTQSVPLEWLMSVLVPVLKKGDSTDPNYYRGIVLMCVRAKSYNKLLLNRLRSVLDSIYVSIRSKTAQHVLTVRHIFESIDMTEG